jgi:4'-phosphopantetheinyl transferase
VVGGAPSEIVLGTRCGSCGSTEHGKPFLDTGQAAPPVQVNLSHSGPVVCVALAAGSAGIGVDVEARRGVDWAALRRSVFTDDEWAATEASPSPERSRTDAWARKEASVKACGHGLAMPMLQVVVSAAPDGGWSAALPDGAGGAAGRDLTLRDDVASAVAVHHPAGRPEGTQPLRPPVVRQVSVP